MTSQQESLSRLGLTPDARPEQLEARYDELVAFLRSGAIPPNLRDWADAETSLVDEAYARSLDAAAEPAPSLESAASRTAINPVQRERRRDAPAEGRRRWRLGSRPVLAVLAVLLVAGAIAISRFDRGGTPNSPATTNAASQDPNAPVPLDTARVAQWMKAVQENPSNTEALFGLGESYFQAQQWQVAIDWFTRLVSADPKNVHAMADIGTANFNLGRFDLAKAAWQSGLEVAPTDPQLHYNLGFLAANTEPPDYAAARREWQAVIDSAPDSDLAKTVKIHMSSLPSQ